MPSSPFKCTCSKSRKSRKMRVIVKKMLKKTNFYLEVNEKDVHLQKVSFTSTLLPLCFCGWCSEVVDEYSK